METGNDSNNKSWIGLSFLWPFVSLINCLRNWRQPWAMNAFWLVCIYMGAIQIYQPAGSALGEGVDGGRYAMQLIEMHDGNTSLLEEIALNFAFSNAMDYYQLILTWLVSCVTGNAHVLFACFAAVFGYFYSRNMWYVLNRISTPFSITVLLYMAVLFLICPIWSINGVRMWTAAQVFVFAILPYICEGNKKSLLWLIIVPFVHFSFLYLVILSGIAVLLPEKFTSNSGIVKWGLILLFISSLAPTIANVSAITNVLEQFSLESYQNRIDLYTSDIAFENMAANKGSVNWYVTAASDICYWVSNILLLVIAFTAPAEEKERKLLYFTLLVSIIANFASQIPSGSRFMTIAHMFSYSLILWQITKPNRNNSMVYKFARILAIPLIITIIFSIRKSFEFYGISLFCGNIFSSIFWDNNVQLIGFLK